MQQRPCWKCNNGRLHSSGVAGQGAGCGTCAQRRVALLAWRRVAACWLPLVRAGWCVGCQQRIVAADGWRLLLARSSRHAAAAAAAGVMSLIAGRCGWWELRTARAAALPAAAAALAALHWPVLSHFIAAWWWPATAMPNFSIAVGPRGFFLSSVRSMQHTTCQGPVTSTRLAGLCGAHWSSTAAATRGCVAELAAGQARQAAAAAASSCKPALPLFAPRVLPPHACCLMCTSALHKRLWVGAI